MKKFSNAPAAKRFGFEITAERVKDIQALAESTGIATNRELFNNALTLLEWAVDEVKQGRTIASIDEQTGVYRELHMPLFRDAKALARPKVEPK